MQGNGMLGYREPCLHALWDFIPVTSPASGPPSRSFGAHTYVIPVLRYLALNPHPKPCFFREASLEVRSPCKTLPQHQIQIHYNVMCPSSIQGSQNPFIDSQVKWPLHEPTASTFAHEGPYFSCQQSLLAASTENLRNRKSWHWKRGHLTHLL